MLMFAGGGSGSVAGGIKVTTFALLLLVVWAELRGESEVNAFSRRIPAPVQRQALTLAVISVNAVVRRHARSCWRPTTWPCRAIALRGDVGLHHRRPQHGHHAPSSTASATRVLMVLMFLGRVGPLTLGVALVLRERERLYSHPEERPLVG